MKILFGCHRPIFYLGTQTNDKRLKERKCESKKAVLERKIMKKNIIISPSVLACDYANAGSEVKKVYESGAEYLHLDVMDGIFVPNISFGPDFIKALRPYSKAMFDTHLMIVDPIRYIDVFVDAGSDIITIHTESCDNVEETLKYIKSKGVKAGVVIKPKTSVSDLAPFLPYVDMILLMSVEPGFGGQSFIESTYETISKARKMIDESGFDIDLEVDGGINSSNVNEVMNAGANVIVAGSAVFKSDSPEKAVKLLKGN